MSLRDLGKIAINGERRHGEDVRNQNVTAVVAIANIVKTSLGPEGLDKMLVDDLGDIMITNDGATILRRLDVQHPAAKVLVELAELQDKEVGDGTTSVVIIAAELLKRANELVKQKIHATSIISGYRLACKESTKYIKQTLSISSENLADSALKNIAKTSLASKIIGAEADFFSSLCVSAISRVKTTNNKGKVRYPIASVNVLKCHGKSMKESEFVEGFALNCTVTSQAMARKIEGAKIALLDFDLSRHRMHHGVQLTVTDPDELEKMRQRELDITKEKVDLILKAGVNVVLTTKGIDDTCSKYLVDAGAIGIRRVDKKDLRLIAKATGGKVLLTLIDDEGNEGFGESNIGYAAEVAQEFISDKELVYFRGTKNTKTSSIILRGPNDYTLDEMERSVHDALCILKRTLESKGIVPGGGAIESSLSLYLEQYATSLGSVEQLAINEFAEALLVIPKTLAVNAAKDATELVARLRAYHNTAIVEKKEDLHRVGLDLKKGEIRDNVIAGVIEPSMSKIKAIQFATEAAITILRIDDMISINPEPEPEDPHAH